MKKRKTKQEKAIDAYIQRKLPPLQLALKKMGKNDVKKLRQEFSKLGYRIEKSCNKIHLNNDGGFMLIEIRRNIAIDGWNYDLTVKRLKEILKEIKGEKSWGK